MCRQEKCLSYGTTYPTEDVLLSTKTKAIFIFYLFDLHRQNIIRFLSDPELFPRDWTQPLYLFWYEIYRHMVFLHSHWTFKTLKTCRIYFGYRTKKIGSKTSKEVGSFDFHGLITVKSGNGSSCSGYNICPLQQKLGLYFHKIIQLHYHQYSWKVHERLTAAWICVFILV